MYAGGSGEFNITHVKFMVDPLSMYKSGAPIISVEGSAQWKKKKRGIRKNLVIIKILPLI